MMIMWSPLISNGFRDFNTDVNKYTTVSMSALLDPSLEKNLHWFPVVLTYTDMAPI